MIKQIKKQDRGKEKRLISMIPVFFFFILLVLPSTAILCGDLTDCNALLKFKEAIISDPERHLQAWTPSNPLCNWTGITCHSQLKNRVVALKLIDMELQGIISPFISNLSLLTNLSLQGNRFHGEIPTSLGQLSELVYLNTRENRFVGNIPPSLRGCQSLKLLDLSYSNLSGFIPEEIGTMKSLTYLALSENGFRGAIPSFLSNLTELTQLELAVNYFTVTIPVEFGGFSKLRILYLHLNYLQGAIPSSLSNCTELREISLTENLLTGEIPSELGEKLGNLEKLYLWNNTLSGKIPVSLSNLSQLTLLDLSFNILSGEVPVELGQLTKMERLYLQHNNLVSGSDNSSLAFLTALTNCSVMKKLHLASCFFAGKLPDSIGNLSKELFYLNLLDNYITGKIPDSIGNLSSLVDIYLNYNYLNGKIPETISKLGKLQRVQFSRNRLTGEILDTIGQMSNLGSLDLSNNLISGSLPPSLGKLSNLRYLYLSRNRLSGRIPIELAQCSVIMLLDLSFNNLQGSVPQEIGLFPNLALSLDLSNNNFLGEIPISIVNLILVKAIDFSENNFSGTIPSLIGSCISLKYLNLSNNIVEGIIPESLRKITSLEVLDLAYNQLNGSVPMWIANDRIIKNLNLSYNRLIGEVPNDLDRTSLIGNVGLCSSSSLIDLPPCEVEKPKQNKKRKQMYYVIAAIIISSLSLVALAFAFTSRFISRKRFLKMELEESSSSQYGLRRFTKRELEIATAGFNEDNLLGRGSFGSVYKAIIDDGKTVVAVKVLNADCKQSYKSFKREGRILSNIKHRNLVKMIGLSWSSQFKALVLEFKGNGSLDLHLYPELRREDCRLTLKERMSIAIDIANGLEYLHEESPIQVVHCDLKPTNVLLDSDMVAYVADFGIGKLIVDDDGQEGKFSTTNFLRGSIGYIPPEYGQGTEVSTKGDVYSFGVMLLEIITRKRPTNDMFSDGLELRTWVISAVKNSIWDVVYKSLQDEASLEMENESNKLEYCCMELLELGVACTEHNPQSRPNISSVVRRLKDAVKEMRFD